MRSNHLAMLHKEYSTVDNEAWEKYPSTTNAVERRNADCKLKQPIPLKIAMLNIYKLDKAVCAKHFAAANIVFPTGTEVKQQGVLRLKQGKGNVWLRIILMI